MLRLVTLALCCAAAMSTVRGTQLDGPKRALLQAGCIHRMGPDAHVFSSCESVASELKWDLNLFWNLSSPGGPNTTFTGAIDADVDPAGGYVSVGFSAPGRPRMVGGNALVLKTCANCPTGASLTDFYLGGKSEAAVKPPSQLSISGVSAALQKNRLQGVFTVSLPLGGTQLASVGTIYAVGPLESSGDILYHTHRAAKFTDLTKLGPGLGVSPSPAPAPAV